jgi:multisubunit Na+/H+ antiporter MnhF subunit
VFIIAGHALNAVGPGAHPWNILAFFLGTIAFFIWTVRVANKPQMAVNVVALGLGALGLVKSMT